MKRRLVVWDDLPEGGAKRVVWEQVRGLSSQWEVVVITNMVRSLFDYSPFAKRVYRFDMKLHPYRGWLRPCQELSYLTRVMPLYRKMARLVTKLQPDLVLVHPTMITQAPLVLKMMSLPTAYYMHEWPRVVYEPMFHPLPLGFHGGYESLRRRAIQYVDSISAKSASLLITTSHYMQHELSTLYKRNVALVAPGVDLKTFCVQKSQQTKGYFLFIGEAEPISGYPLAEAIISRGEQIRWVRLKSGGFRYSDADLASLYRGAVATLCLSQNEPFGLTAIESMACGTPVIAVDSGGYRDTVIHNHTGIRIQPTVASLVTAMHTLGTKIELRQQMAAAGRVHVEQHFSWKSHVDRLKHMLESML